MPPRAPLDRLVLPGASRPRERRPGGRRAGWLLALAAALLALWGLLIEPSRLVERHPSLTVPGLPAMRLALLSDVHAGCAFVDRARLQRVVRQLNAGQPDVIALLGDYVTEAPLATPIPPEVTAALLGELRAPGGVFAVLGNHDHWLDGDRVQRAFEASGIRVLEGEVATTTVRGAPVALLGIPDLTTRGGAVGAALEAAPTHGPVIALTHSPDVFPRVPARVALTVAGHTHGGQVRLPLLGAPIVPSLHGQRYAAGLVTEGGHQLYVTTGLGMSIFPVRFGVPPEIVFLHLNGG